MLLCTEVAAKSPDSRGYQLGSSKATLTVHGWSLLVISSSAAGGTGAANRGWSSLLDWSTDIINEQERVLGWNCREDERNFRQKVSPLFERGWEANVVPWNSYGERGYGNSKKRGLTLGICRGAIYLIISIERGDVAFISLHMVCDNLDVWCNAYCWGLTGSCSFRATGQT